ncbi:MAG: arginyltransferase, partial [Planctomycetota bacterium]
CQACEATRVEAASFTPNRSQRRAAKKGDANFETRISDPVVDDLRVHLFNEHRRQRGLDRRDSELNEEDYRGFLLNAPCQSIEISLWIDNDLKAVSITDVGEDALSAVYCFFDPAVSDLSPGTYAILQQIQLTLQLGRKWLYLGYYVAENTHLNYKSRYRPQQRLIEQGWSEHA